MKVTLLFALLSAFTVCEFCGKDFVAVNRHRWRCPQKPTSDDPPIVQRSSNESGEPNAMPAAVDSTHRQPTKCMCGKVCKNLTGLKRHQRSCKTVRSFSDKAASYLQADDQSSALEDGTANSTMENLLGDPSLKPGVYLPKSEKQWDTANSFFHAQLPCSEITPSNLNESVEKFTSTIYNYFATTYGTKKDTSNSELKTAFDHLTKSQLKNELKRLKSLKSAEMTPKIRYVSKLLRNKITPTKPNNAEISSIDHDREISNGFWGYCKNILEKPLRTAPTFSRDVCTAFFRGTFHCIRRAKTYVIPDWIPSLNAPTTSFDLRPPTYRELYKAIRRMKTSGSPCPLDQISIICFKRCPFLRSYLLTICQQVWASQTMPIQWQRAVTILIHKKGDASDPGNFRPITLEPVCLKVFTSLLRNRMFKYLVANGYAESHIQKGFIPGMSGTIEHIAGMSYVINEARRKQRSVTITLIDLKNAFGEVNHNLIDTCLRYHHIPDHARGLIKNLYGSFATAIATDSFTTEFIPFSKGVLQGDCLSPLLFNMIVNTFVQYIKSSEFEQLGYKYANLFLSRHWYQFADDAAAVTALESENQILLNAFSKWCTWADMIVRVDKCHTFGMRKVGTASKQVKPNLFINNQKVGAVEIGEAFVYLGRSFDFKMTSEAHKSKLIDTIEKYLRAIEHLPLHPKWKLLIYNRFVLSKISWDLTVSDITITWVKQNLDNIVSSFLRTTLEFPISGSLSITTLAKSRYGLNIILPSSRFAQCQVTYRNAQKKSVNQDVRDIHKATSTGKNITTDAYVSTKAAMKAIREETVTSINQLSTQSLIIKSIWEFCHPAMNTHWFHALESLPKSIFNFTQRYLGNCLPNKSNAIKWGISQSATCEFCPETQTLGHVISACASSLREGRYNWRHDSVIRSIARAVSKAGNTVYADIADFPTPSTITGDDERPDIVVSRGKDLFVLELTAGFETNLLKNYQRKDAVYRNLLDRLGEVYENVFYLNLSMSAIGCVSKETTELTKWLKGVGLTPREITYTIRKAMKICMRSSYYIFCRRNSEWSNPDLLDW